MAVAVLVAFRSAQRTLSRAEEIASRGHRIGFSLRPLDPAAAEAQNPGFEPVSPANSYTSGASVGGNLYLAGPAGLSVITADGSVRQRLRTGFELPVAPIVQVTSGRLRGANETQVLLATRGAGVLVLDPDARTLLQLLPDAAEARDVTALLPLASGELLIGTRHAGALLYDGAALLAYAPTEKQARQVTALASADSASIVIGTRDQGLFYVHAGTLQHVDASGGLPDPEVEALVANGGKLFAGTPLGVAQFDLSQGGLLPERVLAKGVFSNALAVDAAAGELLVGTLEQGMERVPLGGKARLRNADFAVAGERIGNRVDSFVSANGVAGPVYALADGDLLAHGSGALQPVLPAAAEALADRNISALAFAPDGSLYVGFFDHGLDVLAATGAVRHLEDDHLFCVNRLVLDPQRQTMTAATANGLVLFDRQGVPRQVLAVRDGLISEHVTDVAFTRSVMTVATPAGLTMLGPGGAESLYAFQGLVNNHVYTLGANGNTLLAGTLGGISVLQGGAVTRNLTATNSGLKHNWITAIAPMPEGGWIVGTYGAGVETMSADGRFERVGLAGDVVVNPNALLVTASHVYAGTLGRGMLVMDRGTGRWDVVTRGLPSENVTAFAERDGMLFVGTENGLVRIAEAKLP